jgi:hypothetical protein
MLDSIVWRGSKDEFTRSYYVVEFCQKNDGMSPLLNVLLRGNYEFHPGHAICVDSNVWEVTSVEHRFEDSMVSTKVEFKYFGRYSDYQFLLNNFKSNMVRRRATWKIEVCK